MTDNASPTLPKVNVYFKCPCNPHGHGINIPTNQHIKSKVCFRCNTQFTVVLYPDGKAIMTMLPNKEYKPQPFVAFELTKIENEEE